MVAHDAQDQAEEPAGGGVVERGEGRLVTAGRPPQQVGELGTRGAVAPAAVEAAASPDA